MPWPTLLSHRNKKAHKNAFGHVLILAGSRRFLGAAALSGLAAMRTGAGLTTIGIPRSLNLSLQKKISPVLMTLPLEETSEQSLSVKAFMQIQTFLTRANVLAVGPGLSTHPSTAKLVKKVLLSSSCPVVLDADALNILSNDLSVLEKTGCEKILTPHPGEMARMLHAKKTSIEKDRTQAAQTFAKKHKCTLLLKGHQTVVASAQGKIYVNTTGNPGMATAGSGDVLTGMIAALLAQGLTGFEAARWAAFLHGLAGDLAAKKKTEVSLIATDIIDEIPNAIKKGRRKKVKGKRGKKE